MVIRQSFIKKVIDVPAEPPRKSGHLKAEWMGKACWENEAEETESQKPKMLEMLRGKMSRSVWVLT